MAYKDEYEVARLLTSSAFKQQLSSRFESGYQLNYHLAPPFLSGKKDSRGRPLKRQYGSWMDNAMNGLAHLKLLRGTPLDVFGYTAERKMERALVPWYLDLMRQCSEDSADNHSKWHGILDAPGGIRGYGIVKEQSVEKVQQAVTAMCDSLSKSA